MTTREVTECNWCGREDIITGSITDDQGDTYHWCQRHEDQVRSLVDDTLTDQEDDE